jgi:hypothetical protein
MMRLFRVARAMTATGGGKGTFARMSADGDNAPTTDIHEEGWKQEVAGKLLISPRDSAVNPSQEQTFSAVAPT